MFTIISKEKTNGLHYIESQSGRTTVWLDGYIEVPPRLIDVAWGSCGYCDLIFDDEGNLTDIIPTEKPILPEPETPKSDIDEIAEAIRKGVNSI